MNDLKLDKEINPAADNSVDGIFGQHGWICPKCGTHHDRDLLAANNIKLFGLQAQNLIGISPAVSGAERVELPTVVGAVKRECV